MPNLGTTEIIIIALVVMVLFGSKKLPDAARSFGRSLRIFKAETKGLREDDAPAPATAAPAAQPVAPLPIESRPVVTPATSVNGASPVDAERR
ncbi:Sec-independent protein translocase TatA [Frankia sp. CcI49]|uniref:Sec-independent protein translocase protein TatA n=1 Tax=Parafrankia irregularis TaxID=795642 RepID=A0A0S4QST0_9ACTN|nr:MULTISPECIES: Sec-independent protein translocase subunit TatA [Frankiaceae]KPM55894.1 primosome assembly protein PriA [Frankia sp. R43]MBE3201801.1 Sec-independent protein translocase subunit TatA [Parafrankia sp. CH37]ONH58240.1 Sec-independent protein translocase TatA [Frankia sp. CcI49]CUU58281.1 sec-independent protein translocase protein TatA [Parafrankia irregularis]